MSEYTMTIVQAAIAKKMSSNGIIEAIKKGLLKVEKRSRVNYLKPADVAAFEPSERQLGWKQKK